jgi:hypothetical protein
MMDGDSRSRYQRGVVRITGWLGSEVASRLMG